MTSIPHALAVAEHASFRGAASRLGVSQSMLSRRVRALEDELGVSLFQRERGGVRETEAGRLFLDAARQSLADLDEAVRRAGEAGRGKGLSLSLGCQISLVSGRLRQTIETFLHANEGVAVRVVEAHHSDLVASLRAHKLDLAFLLADQPDRKDGALALWRERVLVAMSADHRLAVKASLNWSDLRDERFLVGRRDLSLDIQDCIVARLGPFGWKPRFQRHDCSRENLVALAGLGWGVTLLCEPVASSAFPNVVFREVLADQGALDVGMIVYWEPRNDNPALRRLIASLRRRPASDDAV
ncbi:MAG TPA: LysR substrate-binding domain-containing protein [Microvirga sp.]|nr:LysR substrate-binding domain-containing protein [Microvirga sp.]